MVSVPITVMLLDDTVFPVEDSSGRTTHSSWDVDRDIVIRDLMK